MTVTPLPLPSPLPNLFRADWRVNVRVNDGFETDVTYSRVDGSEERQQLLEKPERTLVVTFRELTRDDASQLWMNLIRSAKDRLVMPLYCDQMITTASSTGTTINVPTALRRLSVGARVVIFDVGSDGRPDQVEYDTIDTINANDIELATGLSNTYAAGAYVFPTMDIEIDLKSSRGISQTDQTFEVSFQATEKIGASGLDPLVAANTTPSGFSTYLGDPILHIEHDWAAVVRSSVTSIGEDYGLGRGRVVRPQGERPMVRYDLQLNELTRADVWPVLEFMESRCGRAYPSWLVAPQTLFTPTAITTTYVEVEVSGNIEDVQDFFDYIGILETDGTITIRGISSVSLVSGKWRIAFDSTITAPALSDVRGVTSAHHVRLARDNYQESWVTDEVCSVRASFIDLLDEGVKSITKVTPEDYTLGPIAEIDDLYFWGSAAGNVWAWDGDASKNPSFVANAYPYRDVEGRTYDADYLFDCRTPPGDNALTEPYLQSKTNPAQLSYHQSHYTNNSQRTFYHFNVSDYCGFELENSDAEFWDATDGLTVVVAIRSGGPSQGLGGEAAQRILERAGIFEWLHDDLLSPTGQVNFYATADSAVAAANITYTAPTDSNLRLMAVRWDPGVAAELFIGGGSAHATATTPASSLDTEARPTQVLHFVGNTFGPGGGYDQQIDVNLDRQHFSNEILIFQRAITDDELDTVGEYLAARYNLSWAPIA